MIVSDLRETGEEEDAGDEFTCISGSIEGCYEQLNRAGTWAAGVHEAVIVRPRVTPGGICRICGDAGSRAPQHKHGTRRATSQLRHFLTGKYQRLRSV